MARDFHGNVKCVLFYPNITGEEFQKIYMEMSASPDKTPVASTLLPVLLDNGSNKINAYIFYELRRQPTVPKPKPLEV